MITQHELAIAAYKRSLDHVAERANQTILAIRSESDLAILDRAELLALPATGSTDAEHRPLQSILGHLYESSHTRYYPPHKLVSDAAIPTETEPTDLPVAYQALWRDCEVELARLDAAKDRPVVYEAGLHAVLQRHAWAVPARLVGADDVSLFDFARVSAALAVCMLDAESDADGRALLVGGDISGVQDWLFSFSSSGAAKTLRGRSFYLQLLGEVIALFVLKELDLPIANLLYVGGGNFYLLAPPSYEERLTDLQKMISRKLLVMHGGDLNVAIAHTLLTDAQLQQNVGSAWDAVSKRLGRKKSRRFVELDDSELAGAIGSPIGDTGDPYRVCGICSRIIGKGEKAKTIEGSSRRKCGLCVTFEELGNELPKASFLALSEVEATVAADVADWQEGLKQFGYDVQLLRAARDTETKAWKNVGSELVRIYYWEDDPDIRNFPGWPGDERAVWGFRPLAQCVPFKDDSEKEIATFDEFESDGIKRWGVLRMDVDNLGDIFQHGIPATNLSRVVGLSGLMRLYFEGHVPLLARRYNRDETGRRRPRIYLMYAGGDDLFVVGGWSDLPGLAADIRNDFVQFACGNPCCTISAGISIALGEKYPLYQAARDAGRAEHLAKHWREPEKDSIAILGEPLAWGEVYNGVMQRVEDLRRWVKRGDNIDGKLPSSFLMALRQLDAEWREWKKQESGEKKGQGIDPRYVHANKTLYLGPWQWHMLYSLSRAADRTRDGTLKKEVDELIESILRDEIQTIGLSARWAELLTRKSEQR